MSNSKQIRWMSSGYLQSAPSGGIDEEKGIIEGVSVCTVGEAKGHGVNLDSEFIQRVAELGASKRNGLKARFGHPNMCSTALGTFIGRFKNFRQVGDQVKADLFLSNEAKSTPHGDLYSYVLGMAKNEPDMFGTSIVFTPGELYRRDEEGEKIPVGGEFDVGSDDIVFVECAELHACDAVDDPAANEGLFSRFSKETIAGQVTEFMDLHPQIFEAISENPAIIEALSKYGNKIDEFINRYRAYRSKKAGDSEMSETKTEAAEVAEVAVEELEATDKPEVVEEEKMEAAEAVVEEKAEEPEAPEADEKPESEEVEPEVEEAEEVEVEEPAEEPESEGLSRAEFIAVADEFGNDVAVQIMRDGGTVEDAARIAYKAAQEEIELLKKNSLKAGGSPAKVSEAKETKPLIRISGRG